MTLHLKKKKFILKKFLKRRHESEFDEPFCIVNSSAIFLFSSSSFIQLFHSTVLISPDKGDPGTCTRQLTVVVAAKRRARLLNRSSEHSISPGFLVWRYVTSNGDQVLSCLTFAFVETWPHFLETVTQFGRAATASSSSIGRPPPPPHRPPHPLPLGLKIVRKVCKTPS